jgi:phospho-N-acetylmuramoyl-pentapeptide-transferase
MLYHLFELLDKNFDLPGAGLFQYITFRAGAAIIISLLISMLFGNRIIRSLKKMQVGESVRDLGLEGQIEKTGTPTMGGLIILMSILIPCLLLADLTNVYIQILILSTIWMAAIGIIDDYIKVFKKDKRGLEGKFKVVGQVGLGLIVGLTMLFHQDIVVRIPLDKAQQSGYEIVDQFEIRDQRLYQAPVLKEMAYVKAPLTNVPFFKNNRLDYGQIIRIFSDNVDRWLWLIFIPIIIFIVTAVSNSANLTDGLDGLAAGVSAIIGATLGILAYVSGHTFFANYLNIEFIPYSGEMVVFSACFIGACVGFLWHNSYPAKVFMGDTGSLMIGGVIAAMAILTRKEILLVILCGIFLMESLSVILQVGYFKYTKKKYGEGRRIFRMSPLHHHYQKAGMHEARIVTRFWIVQIMLAIVTIITLKVR